MVGTGGFNRGAGMGFVVRRFFGDNNFTSVVAVVVEFAVAADFVAVVVLSVGVTTVAATFGPPAAFPLLDPVSSVKNDVRRAAPA